LKIHESTSARSITAPLPVLNYLAGNVEPMPGC